MSKVRPTKPWPDPPGPRDPYHPRPLRYEPSIVEQSAKWDLWIALAILSPWILSVIVKIWIGDWSL